VVKPIKDKEALNYYRWSHDRCAICHREHNEILNEYPPAFEVHHIIHGCSGRSDEESNLLLVCPRCHRAIHDGKQPGMQSLTMANVIWAKKNEDGLNVERLNELYFKLLPEPKGLEDAA
jgi:5-methylcytosine-specific restriction endonuclease McrA